MSTKRKTPQVQDMAPISYTDVQIESIRPAITEVERLITAVYNKYGGEGGRNTDYSPVMVVIQTQGQKRNLCGHFRPDAWELRDGGTVHEVSLSSEQLRRPIPEIMVAAWHEAVHLYNFDEGIKDVSKGGRHNKEFQETCKQFSLVATKDGARGFNQTVPTPEAMLWLEKEFQPDYNAFRLFRLLPPPKEPKPNKRQAWSCGCQNVMMAAKLEFKATCTECDNPFTKVDGKDKES